MKASVEHCRAFLIDWDGTLIDSLPIKVANAAELFADRFSVDEENVKAAYARHSGIPRRELFDRIAEDCIGGPLSDPVYEEISEAFTNLNRNRIAARAHLRDGTLEALEELSQKGRLLFISTATAQEEIDSLADAFGVASLCSEVMGSRPGFAKGPTHAAHVASHYDLQTTEMAGIGDDVHDMKLFALAGIMAIGITGTRNRRELISAGADLVVDNMIEVVEHAG
jgi:phosphoglycolate phosphatase-like HAD superfamily hydrolase